ncbi:uncharacterized protein [Euwallacea similis]|uniref:uncharacterized protein isoform X2 n=1 Tax=Euwallacea similis TaxID=1736056 RepID=UPI00344CE89B
MYLLFSFPHWLLKVERRKMDDEDYNQKLESLQRYVPFLVTMITELKAKGNREAQLTKMQSLYNMISNNKKKLKVETLQRCEQVLNNIYFKVNPQLRGSKMTSFPESPMMTPRSPSPLNNLSSAKPVTIPTEKIVTSSKGKTTRNPSTERRSKVDIYSCVVLNPESENPILETRLPDMSKPPISLDDLKMLEDDVQQKISNSVYDLKSVDELQEVRRRLQFQLKVDEINSALSPPEEINTTVRNTSKLSKKRVSSESKLIERSSDTGSKTKSTTNPIKEIKSPTSSVMKTSKIKCPADAKTSKGKEKSDNAKASKNSEQTGDINILKSKEESSVTKITKNIGELPDNTPSKKCVKEVDIFADVLSSIDSKILDEKKKSKKSDRRLSATLNKEDSTSCFNATSQNSDTKMSGDQKTKGIESNKLSSKDKVTGERKLKSSSLKVDQKEKEKFKSSHMKDSAGNKFKDGKIDKDKTQELHSSETQSCNKRDGSSKESLEAKTNLKSDYVSSGVTKNESDITVKDSYSSKNDPEYSDSNSLQNRVTPYKRLADKYHPKPKLKKMEGDNVEIDKAISESIENAMKISPGRTIVLEKPKVEAPASRTSGELGQLPDILQKIFSKPLLGDIIPKIVHDPRTASSIRENKVKANSVPQPGNQSSRQPLHFEPPRFISPSHVTEPMISPTIIGSQQNIPRVEPHTMSRQYPASQQFTNSCPVVMPTSPMPTNFPIRFDPPQDESLTMDFTPSTPRADFDQFNYSPAIAEQQVYGFDRGCGMYVGQMQYPQQQREMFNQYENFHSSRSFYGGNQMPFPNTQPYMPDQGYHERYRWNRDRRPGDPRNYREYREMKERKEKAAAAAAEEKNKEIKDPRLAPRESRDDSSSKDPKQCVTESSNKDKLSKDLRSGGASEEAPDRSKEDPESKSTRELKERTKSKDNSKYESSKFDKMYSVTKTALRSRVNSDEDESFTSPLDSLYSLAERKTGRGYGVQAFKIPRKSRRDGKGHRSEKDDPERSSTNTKRSKYVISDSDESDAGDIAPGGVSDFEDEGKCEDISVSDENDLPKKLDIDMSRIEVVIDRKNVDDSKSLWSMSNLECFTVDHFFSEYYKELQTEVIELVEKEMEIDKEILETHAQGGETSSSQDDFESPNRVEFKAPSVPEIANNISKQQEAGNKNEEPSEQNILAHFFENLLKSKNKKDKKTALFSLIETFSDSFEGKEIQKIRKIIKVNEENETSDEEKDDPIGSTVAITDSSISKVSADELPIVDSTTEEDSKTPDFENAADSNAPETQTQIKDQSKAKEVSKPGELHNSEETEVEQLLEPLTAEEILPLEPVIVSVGERIKNRRRNTPPRTKKKNKSELDLLHADIKDMFIRDGVLTATGKRMCRILKDDPQALIRNDQLPPLEQPKKLRKKPGPKPKLKPSVQEADVGSMKAVRVVINKMPDEVLNTRALRTRNSKGNYAESDDDDNISNLEGSIIDNNTDIDSEKSEIDGEYSEDSEGDAKSQASGETSKPKGRRRKVARWASGIIHRVKKKKTLQGKSKESSPERVSTPVEYSVGELDVDKLVEPDKSYFVDYVNKRKLNCKLCKFNGIMLAAHYLKEHPQSEVLCSRFAPKIAEDAIKDTVKHLKSWESITDFKMSSKYNYSCRMCGYTSTVKPILFYEHVTTHTGEYRHQCGFCEFTAANSKTMAAHFVSFHPEEERKVIKGTYNSAVIFIYMCGECNFIQLNRKSVEDHANIFHLGEKAPIYKVNMSVIVDPLLVMLDIIDSSSVPGHTGEELEVKGSAEGTKVDAVLMEPTTSRKRPGPKSKTKLQKEERISKQTTEEFSDKSPEPIFRKKPGPKSKTLPVSVDESVAKTADESMAVTPPGRSRRKPGPKSKNQNLNSVIKDESQERDRKQFRSHLEENLFGKDSASRKRKRSLDKLISEDSGDDLDTIISLSSRSSRAAKEKATAKLKTLMESNEGLSPKKKSDVEFHSKGKGDANKVSQNETDHEVRDNKNDVGLRNNEKHDEYDQLRELPNRVDEMRPPVLQDQTLEPSEKDQNVFTCESDIIQEDAKKIEEERLQKMDELNKSIGSRITNLDFINKLSNRLRTEESSVDSAVDRCINVKEEPMDIDTTCAGIVESQVTHQHDKFESFPLISKKPTFEEQPDLPRPNITFRQDKPNSLFTNMIEKLQGKIKEAAVEQNSLVENMSTSNLQLSPSDRLSADGSSSSIAIGDLIKAVKSGSEVTYYCNANKCHVVTKDKMVFQLHCKFGHKSFLPKSTLCEKCGIVVEATQDTTLLENLYDHLVFAHSDFISGSSVLRMRRLSGDKLSIKKEKESVETLPSLEEISREDTSPEKSELISSGGKSSSVSQVNEESEPSEATLELAEDYSFSFKIGNVISLAEQPSEESSDAYVSPVKSSSSNSRLALPPLKQVPPLTIIGTAPKHQTPLVVKEGKQTISEMNRPKKAPKAMQKFIENPGDLYKCPHYYCMFTTNTRMLLTVHLKAHKSSSSAMVPCVYCDMKTPWEHVPVHIDIRHATSRFSCSHCLYRAIAKEYVCLHLEQCHPGADYTVLALPPHKSTKKFAVAEPKVDFETLCEPFRCCVDVAGSDPLEYLFETEFAQHLSTVHANEILRCGYKGCYHTMLSSMMLTHWSQYHGVCSYQCAYCKTSNKEMSKLYTHFSQIHANLMPYILVRKNDFLPQHRELRFTEEAFRHLGHQKQFPTGLLAAIGKRRQRSIRLIQFSSSNLPAEELTNAAEWAPHLSPTTSSQLSSSLLVNSAKVIPNVQKLPTTQTATTTPQILLSHNTVLNKIIMASTPRTNDTRLLLFSTPLLPSNTVPSVTSTASISKVLVQTSTASKENLLQQSAPKDPVRIGGITLYPADNSGVEFPVITNSPKTSAPSKFISDSVSESSTSLISATSLNCDKIMLADTKIAVSDQTSSKISEKTAAGSTVDKVVQFQSFDEDMTSENTALSEDDILQSAIQSILDQDDESNNSLTKLESNLTKASTQNIIESNIDTNPPPLVLLASKNSEAIGPSVEHIDMPGDIVESGLAVEQTDPLNIQANDESNPELPFINTDSLDALVEDPLSITPTLNLDMSSEEPLVIDENALLKDPLEESVDKNIDHPVESPLKITNMERSVSTVSISDDESDCGSSDKKKKNLMGYQLFRCSACNLSFSNVKSLKLHLSTSSTCKNSGTKAFKCVHCDKWLKSIQRLCDHIMTHGIKRFSCSLCEEKFTLVQIAKFHMKNRHSIHIHQTSLMPLNADQNDFDVHEFVIKPTQTIQSILKDKNKSNSDSPKPSAEECSYTPDQIDTIPSRQIYSTNIKCGLCNYQTKVRVNIIRHLQMHTVEKAVPDIAPINPVPCLEKNEKMFDKMINLAASSITTGRMGGVGKDKEKEEENYPEFVPSHRRYVCGAQGCAYLCPEEANLKHHLIALHRDEYDFTCSHCKKKIETSDIEAVIKHFKFHGLHLYKCHYCSFLHPLKHKVERHISDGHLDATVKVITLRAMESEPLEEDSSTIAQPLPFTPSKLKPWGCCMCKAKYHTEEEIKLHIVKKHNIDAQYKCTLCSFKNDEKDKCKVHFNEKHPGHEFDIIFVYQKTEEEPSKENTISFDTTPLWQRDKPRVRHIRGILFDEASPQPTKSPKKRIHPAASPKISPGPTSKPVPGGSQHFSTKSIPSTPGSVQSRSGTITPLENISSFASGVTKNLFDCIEAVVRGTSDSFLDQPGPSGMSVIKKSTTSQQSKDITAGSVSIANTIKEVSKFDSDSDDDSGLTDGDIIAVTQPVDVIVIDSGESDLEYNREENSQNISNFDDTPKSKDKDSKTNPIAKNRKNKRPGSDLFTDAVKIAKIEDDDEIMAEACSRQNLLAMYGPLGSPNNKQWKCPRCQQFKSKRVGDFMFHLYKDLNTYRFRCKLCSDLCITYKYMQEHLKIHHSNGTDNDVEELPSNIKLDTWIHMVIREQSKLILEKSTLFKKRPLIEPTDIMCYFCNDKFVSMSDCCEHMLYHWVMMPYQCQHCPSEFYTIYDLRYHHRIEHRDAKLYDKPKGPTLARAVQCIEANYRKKPPKPLQQHPSNRRCVNLLPDMIFNNMAPVHKEVPIKVDPTEKVDNIINLEDDNEPQILSNPDDAVSSEDNAFACDFCVHVSYTKKQISDHLHMVHGVKIGRYHILSKSKAETDFTQKYACNICDVVLSELKLRLHFIETHLGNVPYLPYRYKCGICDGKFLSPMRVKAHYKNRHPTEKMDCKTIVGPPSSVSTRGRKRRLYSCTLCNFTTISTTSVSVKLHLKGHMKPIACDYCDGTFKSNASLKDHTKLRHPGLEPSFTIIESIMEEFTNTMKVITKNAGVVTDQSLSSQAKNVAKKSTSAPARSGRYRSKDFNLSSIVTTFEMDGLEYTTTAEEMKKMFNMNTYVDLSGCVVAVNNDPHCY